MTEAPEEVSKKPVDLDQTPVDEKEIEEFLFKTSGTEPAEDATQETVQQSSQNGSKQGEQKPDDTLKEEKDIAGSLSEEGGGTGNDVNEPSLSTGDERLDDASAEENEFLQSLEEPSDPKTVIVGTHVSKPGQSEELSSDLGQKNEDEESLAEQLARALSGYEEPNERSTLERDGLISDELVSASEGAEDEKGPNVVSANNVPDSEAVALSPVEQEITPVETESSEMNVSGAEVPDKEISTQSLGSEPIASAELSSVEVAEGQEADKNVSETPDTTKLDELTIMPETESPGVTVEDTDKEDTPSLDVHDEGHLAVLTNEDVPGSAESGEEESNTELSAAKGEDVLERQSEPEDVNVMGTGSQDDTDRGGVEETSTVECTEPPSAKGTDEETRHDDSSAESVLNDKDLLEAEGGRDVAPSESSVPESLNETDSEPQQSVGLVESVGAGVVSLTSAVFESAKELVGLEKPEVSESLVSEEEPQKSPVLVETNEEVEGSAAPVDITEADDKTVSKTEEEEPPSKAEPLGLEERSLSEAVGQEPDQSSVEKVKDSEDSVQDGGSKESLEVLESDDKEEGVAPNVGPGETAAADITEAEEKIESKPDEEEPLTKAEPVSIQERSLSEAGNEVPEESSVEKVSEDSVSEEEPKQSPGVVQSGGDGVISPSSGVLVGAEGSVGLENVKDSKGSVSEGEPKQSSGVLESDEKVEGIAPVEGSSDKPPSDITEAVEKVENKPDEEEPSTKAESVGIQERSISEAGDQVPEELSLETVKDPEDSVSEPEPKQSPDVLESVDDDTIPETKRQEDISDNPTIVNAEKHSTAVPPTTPSTISDEPKDHLSTSAPKAAADEEEEKEIENAGPVVSDVLPEKTVQADESEKPTFVVGEKALPALYQLPTPPTTVNDEPRDDLVISAPEASVNKEDEKESANVGTEVSALQGSSQIGEVSSSTIIDGRLAEDASRLKALPSEEQSSIDLQNVNGGTAVVTSEQSDVGDGVKERSFNVVVPEREGEKKPVAESVLSPSTPTTPSTPGGTPLIKRVEQLEKKLAQFEDKQNSPKSQKSSTGPSTPRSSTDRPSRLARHTLEETLSKGSLLDRVAALERKLGHVLSLPADLQGQDVSSSAAVSPAVKEEAPAAAEPESTHVTQGENVNAPLKPLKLDFGGKATPVSNSELESKAAEEPLEPKGAINSKATENLVQLNTKEDSGAMEDLARLKAAEDSAKVSEDHGMLKAAEGSRSVNFGQYTKPTTSAPEVKTAPEVPVPEKVPVKDPVPSQEQPAAATKKAQPKNGKSEGPVSKLKARFIGCFARGGKKETAV